MREEETTVLPVEETLPSVSPPSELTNSISIPSRALRSTESEESLVNRPLTIQELAKRHAAETLKRRQEPIAVPTIRKIEEAIFGEPRPVAQFSALCFRWELLYRGGMNPDEALIQAARSSGRELRLKCDAIVEQVRAGIPFSEAFRELEELFPPIARPILAVGERTGRMGRALAHLARETKTLAAQEKRFEYSIFNPGITIPLALCLPLISVGFVTESPVIALAYGAFAIAGSMFAWTHRWQIGSERRAKLKPSRKKLRSSREGIARRSLQTMRWGAIFASLYRSDVPISEALEVAGESCKNAHYREMLEQAAKKTRMGFSLPEALQKANLVPPELVNRLRTAHLTGNFDSAMDEFSKLMEADAKELGGQHFFMRRILPIVLMVSGFIVGSIVGLKFGALVGILIGVGFYVLATVLWEFLFQMAVSDEADRGVRKKEDKIR